MLSLIVCSFLPLFAVVPMPCDRACLLERRAELQHELAEVNRLLEQEDDDQWVSLDLGLDFLGGTYGSVGLTTPVGPTSLSVGYWAGKAGSWDHGMYVSLGYSFVLGN